MRPYLLCLTLLAVLAPVARSADHRNPDDATLRAIQFIDEREGWAIGDEGVIWHSIDGGKNWERQPCGHSGSLQSLHFLNPYVGWIVGREELPGGGSSAVVLYTRDGGVNWRRLLVNALPGLHVVRFVDEKTGYLAGESTDQFPSGVFATTDGGRTWQPVPGGRATCWHAADFDAEGGALGGAWNRLATVRRGKLFSLDMDTLGGRAIKGVQLRGEDAVAVGQGGLVLVSKKGRGSSWHYAEMKLARDVRSAWDFHAVGGVGKHVWAVGRPGSAALHSSDLGQTWEVVRTGQSMPLHGVFFRDEKHGWAVGELGTIVATHDGGKSWSVARRGGSRMAGLCVHGRPADVPLDTVALVGACDGYLMAGLCVTSPDPQSAASGRVGEPMRFNEAFRQSGGAAGSSLWQFPVGSHLARVERDALVAAWDKAHGGRASQELLAQLVLAIRAYKPEVILTDNSDPKFASSASALVAEAVKEAFARAADPKAFPEHLETFGLEAWQPKKLYVHWGSDGPVKLDLTQVQHRLGFSAREFSTAPLALAGAGVPPSQRAYKLVADNLEGSAGHRDLMQGITLASGGFARRKLTESEEMSAGEVKAAQHRAHLWAIAEAPANTLTNPHKLLAQIGPSLEEMPQSIGARVAHGLASQYARKGQWAMAREVYLMLLDRYPAHPLAVDAARWLLMHNSSSEARRRHELGQFLIVGEIESGIPIEKKAPAKTDDKKGKALPIPEFTSRGSQSKAHFASKDDVRRWFDGALTLHKKLAAFGPMHASDPAIGFCVLSAKRQLGDVKGVQEWCQSFAADQPDGPWKQAALAELWLANRVGESPKATLASRPAGTRPYLDGKLDEVCWQQARATAMKGSAKGYETEVKVTHDRDFVYVAVRCNHPEGEGTRAAETKAHDGDLRKHDRVSILLDLDRDYSTYFHLQVDASGCLADDCWGDRSWNPRWFVAIHREKTSWTLEAAIPRESMTGDHITTGKAWAANVIRVLPGKGVQAVSQPAEAPEEAMRPEGMGLLMFLGEDVRKAESNAEGAKVR